MPQLSYALEELLPHRAPMILIDGVKEADLEEKTLTAYVTVKPEWSASHVAIEFMAQSAAALAGLADKIRHPDKAARPGFLLGTRKLTLGIDRFKAGETYFIKVKNEFGDDTAGSFSCRIEDGEGMEVASAILNAYRPINIEEFMKGLQQ